MLVAQSCLTLSDLMDFSLPGFFIPNLWYCVLAAQKTHGSGIQHPSPNKIVQILGTVLWYN